LRPLDGRGTAITLLLSALWGANPVAAKIGLANSMMNMNMYLLQRYRPSALAAWSLITPIFGVLVSAVIAGDALGPTVVLSTLMVAAGIGLTTRR